MNEVDVARVSIPLGHDPRFWGVETQLRQLAQFVEKLEVVFFCCDNRLRRDLYTLFLHSLSLQEFLFDERKPYVPNKLTAGEDLLKHSVLNQVSQ